MFLRRLSLVVLVVCAAVVTVTPDSTAGYVAGGIAAVGLLIGLWVGASRPSPGGRLPWILIALGLSLWLFVDIGLDPFGVGEMLWLAGYPIFNASFVIMTLRRARGQATAGLLDGLTLTTAATLMTWQVVIQPALGDATVRVIMLNAAYLLGDFITLASLLFLVLSPGRRGAPTRLLVGSASTALILELTFHISDRWAPFIGDHIAGMGLLAYGMCVAAMLRHDRDELVSQAPVAAVETLHPARVLFLGLAILSVPLLAVTRGDLALDDRILLTTGIVVTTALSLVRFVGAVREQERVQRALAHQADHDALTGLANRRAFANRLDQRQPDARRTVFYIDLDRFKPVNDKYGHEAGDAVLTAVAERLRRSVRPSDLVARLGGDEFAVLCAGLEPADEDRLTDRLAAAIAEPIAVGGDHQVRVGASIGVASTGDGIAPQTLITHADHAMFDAKHNGNRQLVASE